MGINASIQPIVGKDVSNENDWLLFLTFLLLLRGWGGGFHQFTGMLKLGIPHSKKKIISELWKSEVWKFIHTVL